MDLKLEDPETTQPASTQFLDEILETLSSAQREETASKDERVGCDGHLYIFAGTVLFLLCVNLNLLSVGKVHFWVALIPVAVCLCVYCISFVVLEDDSKWIKTESKSLGGLLKDASKFEYEWAGWDGYFSIFAGTVLFMLYVHLNLLSLNQVLFCVALIPIAVYLYVYYVSFVVLGDDIEWIKTESRWMCAIVNDAVKVQQLSAKIEARALQLWEVQHRCHGKRIVGLDEKQETWVKETKPVVEAADKLVKSIEKRTRRFWIMFKNLRMVADLLKQSYETRQVKEKMVENPLLESYETRQAKDNLVEDLLNGSYETRQVKEKMVENPLGESNETRQVKEETTSYSLPKDEKSVVAKICADMEQSRHKIRCLLDRPIGAGHDRKWVSKSKTAKSAAVALSNLIAEAPALKGAFKEKRLWINLRFVVELLPPFLEEIDRIYLESEIEMAWLDELEDILIDANHAIDGVALRNMPPHGFHYKTPAAAASAIIIPVTNWKAIKKLKVVVKRAAVAFSNLFERKERYDFRFIARYESGFPDPFAFSDLFNKTAHPILSVIGKIQRYLDEMLPMLTELHYKVRLLCDELEHMRNLLYSEYATKGGKVSRIIWWEQMRTIAQMADHCFKTFKDDSDIVTTARPPHTEPAGKKLSVEIDDVLEHINLLKGIIKVFNIDSMEESSSVVGLEKDVHLLVSQLTHGSAGHDHSAISIVGMEGIGKTTLAKKIYTHRAIADSFPLRVWVTLTQDDFGNSIVEQVGKEVLKSSGLNWNVEDQYTQYWIQKVVEILSKFKHILVLDNVSTAQALDTLELTLKFSEIKNGSKILLTTRNRDVASRADTSRSSAPHRLPLRTKEESRRLFNQMVHRSSEDDPRAKELLARCAGLPLAILHLGYLMLGEEATSVQLGRVLDRTKMNDSPLLDAFKGTNNSDVPPHLIKCLSYFRLFPSNSEISARRLVTLWVAEGLVQQRRDENETPEEVAEKYLLELLARNMIQVVERKPNGKVKKCCLPIALQQLWLQNERLDHRLADHFNRDDPCFFDIHGEDSTMPHDMQNYMHLLSFLSFDSREGNKPGEEIGNFLRKGIGHGCFHKLHVLDLEGVFRPQLPNSIVKLSKLRYLGLRWTYLETIPSIIGKLVHLETLDVKHTYVRTLPSSIWKLQNLRHLYLNQRYRSQIMRHPSGSSLKNLQTLWGIFVDEDSPMEDGLDKLVNLRKLGLAFQLSGELQQGALTKWIVKLKHLQSLRLRSIGETGESHHLFLECFLCLENLSSLDLFGILGNPSFVDKLPHNLTSLTLSASYLTDDPMPKLEKLPNLTLLCLYGNSYTGTQMVCSTGKFPQLLVLRMWKLEQLEELEVNENAMQNLIELEIRSCRRLGVPAGLKHLKNLIELKLSDMPQEFAETMEDEKKTFWDDIVQSPSIIVSS